MSILTIDTNINAHLQSLQQLFEGKHATLNWLVISHDDPRATQRLSQVIDDPSAAMLQVPQQVWDFHGTILPEVVRWSISDASVKHLVLVGHSGADVRKPSATWITNGAPGSSANARSRYNRLIDGANRVQSRIRASQEHFINQVAQLHQIDEVSQAVSEGRLQIHALFYIAQSGAYMALNEQTRALEPIEAQAS